MSATTTEMPTINRVTKPADVHVKFEDIYTRLVGEEGYRAVDILPSDLKVNDGKYPIIVMEAEGKPNIGIYYGRETDCWWAFEFE